MTQRASSAVIFGAGNIGRGFIGQLFSESGYAVTFVDVDEPLIAALNRQGGYRLQTVLHAAVCDYQVGPVRALHARHEADAVAAAVAGADLAATAVGGGALKYLVPNLVNGLRQRAVRPGAAPLNILLCENLKGAAAQFKELVKAELPVALHAWLEANVGFVDTVIGRMVPAPTPEMRAADPGFIRVEPYKELPVDRNGFRGAVPEIVGMTAHAEFAPFTARKLYLHNCGHAMLAYLGWLRGHELGVDALRDPQVSGPLAAALQESAAGIAVKYQVERAWLDAHVVELMDRFANRALGDTIFRLGRDPVRKLAPSDRLIGAARVAESAGAPRHLAQGIAAALRFAPAEDAVAVELQQRLAAEGVERVLADLCQIRASEPLGRLVLAAYAG